MRLSGALAKTQKYIEDKFSGKGGVAPVGGKSSWHAVGRAEGRAAADRVALGRRGVNGVMSSKKLGDGR